MRYQITDMIGKIIGDLTVIEIAGRRGSGGVTWRCRCTCGNFVVRRGDVLRANKHSHCGCLHGKLRSRHGMKHTRIWSIWRGMRARCSNASHPGYSRYGGRGISICERWQMSFENFFSDMGFPPTDKHTLERRNNDGNYCPENCEWATPRQQARNRVDNRKITYNGVTQCLAAWAAQAGLSSQRLQARIKESWSIERALTTPVRCYRRNNHSSTQSDS